MEHPSPTGKYKLIILTNKDPNIVIRQSKGTFIRISDNKIIAEIDRNYDIFHFSFFIKNNEEWVQTGKTYMSQTFINLDKEQIFDDIPKIKESKEYKVGKEFIWTSCFVSPNGNTLAAVGCIWACPYEYRFFDITDISKGWPELLLDYGCDFAFDTIESWNEKEIFTIIEQQPFEKVNGELYEEGEYEGEEEIEDIKIDVEKRILKREDNKMVTLEIWKSDYRIKKEKEYKEYELKRKEEAIKLKNESEIFKEFKSKIEGKSYNNHYGVISPMFKLIVSNFKWDDDLDPKKVKKEGTISWNINGLENIKLEFWYYGKGYFKTQIYPNKLDQIDIVLNALFDYLDNYAQ